MRVVFRMILGAAMLFAFVGAGVALWKLGPADAAGWATVAAALAVVAAVASAWTSQRVLELQEDAQEPNPVPVLDLRSRYQVVQFRITNHGGESAHNVRIAWQRQLSDTDGNDVLLGRDVAIPVIPPGESASLPIGGSYDYMKAIADTTYRGTVSFTNVSGRRYSRPFVVSAEHERAALIHDEERPRTEYELQKIPEKLDRIRQEVAEVVRVLKPERQATPPTEPAICAAAARRCGSAFQPRRKHGKWCSSRCRLTAWAIRQATAVTQDAPVAALTQPYQPFTPNPAASSLAAREKATRPPPDRDTAHEGASPAVPGCPFYTEVPSRASEDRPPAASRGRREVAPDADPSACATRSVEP